MVGIWHSVKACGEAGSGVTFATITANHIQEILDDWNGECNFVPANDARVFFAAWNGQPLNPYGYSNFESLLRLLQKIQK